MLEKTLFPVFVGTTEAGETIVLYRKRGMIEELHIQCPDGELKALSPDAEVVTWVDSTGFDTKIHTRIESPEWSGTAVGTRHDLVAMEPR